GGKKPSVILFTAIKRDDVAEYRQGLDPEHYSDVLRAAYPSICTIDYFTLCGRGAEIDNLSGSEILPFGAGASKEERLRPLAPAMLLAEMLLHHHGSESLLRFEAAFWYIAEKFGASPIGESAIRMALPDLFASSPK